MNPAPCHRPGFRSTLCRRINVADSNRGRCCVDCGTSLVVKPVGRPPERCPTCRAVRAATMKRACKKSPVERMALLDTPSVRRRFEAKVDRTAGCWLWTGAVDGSGYGKLVVGGHLTPAHRVSYHLHIAPIPDGLMVGQRCDVPRCVRPDHLLLVTMTDRNGMRGRSSSGERVRIRLCIHGHALTNDNLYTWPRHPASRHCLTCRRLAAKNRYALKVAATVVPFTPVQLRARFDYFGNRCWICGEVGNSMDHVKPLSRGGAHMLGNLRPACRRCNSRKQAKWPFSTERRVVVRPLP